MGSTSPREEIELTDDLLDYAKKVAFKEASNCCGRFGIGDVDFHMDEAAGVALLELSR